MERAGEMQSTLRTSTETPGRGRRLLIKVVAWTLAVPALCAAVLVGGAVPLYLLLPDAKPAAQGTVEMAQTDAPASQEIPLVALPAIAEPADAAASQTSEAVDETTTGTTTADAVPDEERADAPAETIAATVIPTPRPAIPLPDTQLSSAGETREVTAAAIVPPRPDTPTPEADRPEAPLKGRRMVVRTAAKLRAAPQGAEIGVVREGTEIVVGRCDRWCEVSADGRRGFVHASLIDNGTKRTAGRPAGRSVDARPAARRRADERRIYGRPDRYDRPPYARPDDDPRDYDRRFYDRAYRRGEDPDWLLDDRDLPPEEPRWYVEDERPVARRRPPVVLYEEPYPYYDPYP